MVESAFAAPLPLRDAVRTRLHRRPPPVTTPNALQTNPHTKRPNNRTHHHHKSHAVIVAGKFDALHIGHRHLVQTAAKHGKPTLLSFSGMAARLKWPPRAPITAPSDRSRILRAWQTTLDTAIDTLVLPFDSVVDLSPDAFVRLLKSTYDARAIVCGADWRFGKGASGNVTSLKQSASSLAIHVDVASTLCIDGQCVSSTRIRNALSEGHVALVATLLGRYHRVLGSVVSVDAHGAVRCAGFVNQMPAAGLYEAVVRVVGRTAPTRCTVQVVCDGGDGDDGECVVLLFDRDAVYCAECDMYVDFVHRLV